MYTYEKKSKQKQSPLQRDAGADWKSGMPNSALRGMLPQGERSSGGLGQRMQDRLPAVPIRPQAQIPQAEAEADRLSANVRASSPEGVKADLGRRMGADFSNVRFHTGADAAARANAMGARAFTSGADVYFGQGGFDPGIAAHELVHTAQQGVVDSSTATMSTPEGGVQMMPNPFKWAWSKTGGRMIRKNHDAIDELHEAKMSGEWANLTQKQKNEWKRNNWIAYLKYMRNRGKQGFIDSVNDRIGNRQKEINKANTFLAGMTNGHNSMISGDEAEMVDTRMDAEEGLDLAADITDNYVNTPLGVTGGFLQAADVMGGSTLGGLSGTLGIMTGGYESAKSIRDTCQSFQEGDYAGAVNGLVDSAGNLSSTGGSISSLLDAAGIGGAGTAAAGLSVISGGVNMYQGGRDIHEARMKGNAMSEYLESAGKREDLSGDELLLRDIAAQGKMESTRQKIEGSGNLITGAMDALGGALELGGVTSWAGAGLQAGSAALKAGFAGANAIQRNRMKKKVVEQTTGLTDEMIKRFQITSGIQDFSRAKQALMKALGYTSGTRAELYADQTEKRGQKLAAMANANNASAATLAAGLGVEKGTTGYNAEELSQAMGLDKSRSEIASRAHRIHAMKVRNDAARQNAQNTPAPAAAPAPAAQANRRRHWWNRRSAP